MTTQADKALAWLKTKAHEGQVSITTAKRQELSKLLRLNNNQRTSQIILTLVREGRLIGAKGEYMINEAGNG